LFGWTKRVQNNLGKEERTKIATILSGPRMVIYVVMSKKHRELLLGPNVTN
tara:strand:- start:408 stop:560 length:153 start_codon:yes stop_codon:yes gene_type:complete